jgi:deazaflavin-dependent oxidoreductase (nitroreductase family)
VAARYRPTVPRRLLNAVLRIVVPLGVGPANTYLLTVPGRRSGRLYTTPVTLVEHWGERWLVAPYGERSWVKNARASGWVELRRGRDSQRVEVSEVPAEERGPILREYVERVPVVAKFFDAQRGSAVAAFAAEAARHPVFRLRPQPR